MKKEIFVVIEKDIYYGYYNVLKSFTSNKKASEYMRFCAEQAHNKNKEWVIEVSELN